MTGIWLASYIALWLLFVVVAVAVLSIMRNLGIIYDSLAGSLGSSTHPTKLAVGQPLPDLNLPLLNGRTRELSAFRGTKTAFLVVSPHCAPCHQMLIDVISGDKDVDPLDPAVQQKVVVSVGNLSEIAELKRHLQLPENLPIMVDTKDAVGTTWGITSTPATVIVDDKLHVVRQVFGAPGMGAS